MVVIPNRRSSVIVRILESGKSCSPLSSIPLGGFTPEVVIPSASFSISCRYVHCFWQIPCLRVPIAFIADTNRTMHMGDNRDGAGVWTGCALEGRTGVTTIHAAGRVRPVQGLINWKQVWQV